MQTARRLSTKVVMKVKYIIIPTALGTKIKMVIESDYNNQKSPMTIEELIDSVMSCSSDPFTLDIKKRDEQEK